MDLHHCKNTAKLTLATLLFFITLAACNGGSAQTLRYGKKVHYAQGEPLDFPDLTLEFVGITEYPPSDLYPRSMYAYEFKASKEGESQLISWSSGTGDIGPTFFEISGKKFSLELALSDELGPLEKDELVVWRLKD